MVIFRFNNSGIISSRGYSKEQLEFIRIQINLMSYSKRFECMLRTSNNEPGWTLVIDTDTVNTYYHLPNMPTYKEIEYCIESAEIELLLHRLDL